MTVFRRKIKKLMFSFRTKVTALAVTALIFVAVLSNFFIYRYSVDSQFQQLRHQLMIMAQMASLQVDGDALMRVPLNREEGTKSPEYKDILGRLYRMKALDPSVKYLYTLRKTDKPDVWQFVVDADPEMTKKTKKEITAYPGDPYFVGRFPQMVEAYNGPTSDPEVTSDEWGIKLSAYAPIRNAKGEAVAVIGVDMDARNVYWARQNIRRAAIWVLTAGIALSIVLGIFLSGRMTARIKKIIEGTRRLASGDLQYRVAVKGDDEIGELAASFNQMAASLLESRKKIAEYYFRMVQSLVRMLEAKDRYTQGHSERVGAYAQKIALAMGYSKEEADLLMTAGELHDIGKLAVHENILNKQGPLTEEEWEVIRQHPVIGAETLKPVCFHEIIMVSIYSHHERHDGKGYPQKIKGEEISIFAQMIAVADAYDAMTTTRSYRKAMDKKWALDEIRKHSGTQFHPGVAEAFIRAMEE